MNGISTRAGWRSEAQKFRRTVVGFADRLRGSGSIGVVARHAELSAIASADDETARPSERLLDLIQEALPLARAVSMDSISARITCGPRYPDVWPGEHYKLLAALVKATRAQRVVEVGTFTGLGTLALLQELPRDGTLTTFDIVPWQKFPAPALTEQDFVSGQLQQVVADVCTDEGFAAHRDTLREADLIFADAAKDGVQERIFLARFEQVGFVHSPVIVFDDIRVVNMLQIWRDIRRPKLDVTSFGHWSGTGLVDYA